MFQPDWAPSVDDVGAILRARTKDRGGNEVGTFTSTTRPTGDQVGELIETAVADVSAETGDIPDLIQDNARRVAAIKAACLVELGFFPEQINKGQSPYPQLDKMYTDALIRLKKQVADLRDGGELNADDAMPVFAFDCIPHQVDWTTPW